MSPNMLLVISILLVPHHVVAYASSLMEYQSHSGQSFNRCSDDGGSPVSSGSTGSPSGDGHRD